MATDPDATPGTPPADLTPGRKTSEAALTFLVAVLGALPSSGLFPAASPAVKIAGLVVAGLTALGYQNQRTQLKMAHLAHTAALAKLGRITDKQ